MNVKTRGLLASAVLMTFFSCGPVSQNSEGDSSYEEGMIDAGDGVRLFFQKIGDGEQKIIVPLGWWLFDDFKHLAEDGGRTIVFYDVRNRGRSSYVQDTTQLSFLHDARDIETVREKFGFEKVSLVGSSYMGCVVILYAMEHPQHVDGIVQIGAVPFNPRNTFPDSLTYRVSQVDTMWIRRIDSLQRAGYDVSHPREFAELRWNNVSRINLVGDSSFVGRMGSQWGGHFRYENELLHNFNRHLRFHFKSFLAMDIRPAEIGEVESRVLTIAGTRDRNIPFGASKQWASLLPNARFLRVRDAGHIPWVEDPELVFGAIDLFLDGIWPGQAVVIEGEN